MRATDARSVRTFSVHRRGVQRLVTVLGAEERDAYATAVAAVAPAIEAGLGPGVLANRVAVSSPGSAVLLLRPWQVERRSFARALSELAARHRVLGFADVERCYSSIGPQRVSEALRSLGAPESPDIERLLRAFGASGIEGLPVGPPPSAVLANAVLAHVDGRLAATGVAHLRWVDDFVLGVGDRSDAERAIDVVREALRELGLRINERKTRILLDHPTGAQRPALSQTRRSGPKVV